jgi:ribosomal protein S11
MSDSNFIQLNLNRFLKEVNLKKQYIKKIQNKAQLLNELKESNYKRVSSQFSSSLKTTTDKTFVMYIIDISFSKKNTLLHISDCSGNVKFFYSAGSFEQKGKGKVSRATVLRKFYRVLLSKFRFLKRVPVAVHFKNSDSNMLWFLKKLKKKFFITVVKNFNLSPYNGCRKKKIRRKKFKSGSLSI